MATNKLASLLELRAAIRFRKVVRFNHKGTTYQVEPQALQQSLRTGALVLEAWVVEGPETGWRDFCYSELRELEVLQKAFIPRPLPENRRHLIVAA